MNTQAYYIATSVTHVKRFYSTDPCDLNYKHITIVNDNSRVIRIELQVLASTTIVILTTLEVSFTLLENIYSTDITHDDSYMMIVIYL